MYSTNVVQMDFVLKTGKIQNLFKNSSKYVQNISSR